MECKKCGSANVIVQNETTVKTKRRGCIGWFFWLILVMLTCGMLIIIPLLTNRKTKTKHKTVAICQNCGNRWYP